MKRYLILAAVLIFHYTIFAQDARTSTLRLSGKIIDSISNDPMPFTSILILQKASNHDSIISAAVTSEAGAFLFTNLPSGKITMRITYMGYKNLDKEIFLSYDLDLGLVKLQTEGKMLEEVSVTGEKNPMNISIEKRTFNVSKNMTSLGGTAESLLRNVPSLTIDTDGTAKFRNATTTIYINGKPTQLSLAQIPANQIESVELISNPSAKYDASASSGIVNLVLKKNTKPGYNGIVSVGIGNNSRYDAMVSLDLNKGKWNISVLYNLNATQNPLTNYAYRTSFNQNKTVQNYYIQNTVIALANIFQNGRIAIDYNLNNKNSITISANIISGKYNSTTSQNYTNTDGQQTLINYGTRTTVPANNYTTIGAELDWKHSYKKKGKTLSFTSGYNRYKVSNAVEWQTTAYNTGGISQPGYPETDQISGNTLGNQIIGQLDYTHPISDSGKVEIGLRSFTYIRDQQYFFNKLADPDNSYVLVPSYSQDAHITETVNAIYMLYTTKLKRNFSIQAGLRLEQSGLNGVSRLAPENQFGYFYPSGNNNNWIKSLFPSFAITKKLHHDSEIGFNLSRKIGRPGWRQIFVGIQSNDRQNILVGNPALQPEFVNTAEVNYNKVWTNSNWLSTVYFIYEDNTIKANVQPSSTDPSVFITTYTNVKADVRTGFDNTLTKTFFKKLTLLGNYNFFNILLQTDSSSRSLWTYNAKLNLTYKLGRNYSVQFSINNEGRSPQLQGYRQAIWSADFAFRKNFWNNRASIVFTVNDIFNSRRQVMIYDQPGAYQESMSRREVRYFKLTVQIPLGKADNLSAKKKSKKGNDPSIDLGN